MEVLTCVFIISQKATEILCNSLCVYAVGYGCVCVVVDSTDEPYLNLDVAHFGCRANDWPANQCWKDVLWKVGAGIATLDKLKKRKDQKILSLQTVDFEYIQLFFLLDVETLFLKSIINHILLYCLCTLDLLKGSSTNE